MASPPPALWRAEPERVEHANLTHYMRWLAERGLGAPRDYDELWRWSVEDVEGFWSSLLDFFSVATTGSAEPVLPRREMPGAVWFPELRLNYARSILEGRDLDVVALRHASETRSLSEWTWGELTGRVAAIATTLREMGVGPGDRVVAYLPNVAETVAAFLATASLGAVWSSCSPDFGVGAVIDRFGQIEPKILLAVDGYRYGGKDFDRLGTVSEIQRALPTVEHTVVLGYLDDAPDLGALEAAMPWRELERLDRASEPLVFADMPFGAPLWVLYSSGTTGLPKPIVQGHGGILLEHLKGLAFHLDAHRGDRLFWFTTTGWMMWNFLIGGLLTGASIVLYDGNPARPDPSVLWDLAEQAGITAFGTSASYIAECMKAGLRPGREHDLSALETVGSTGSPLSVDGYSWIYEEVKADVWLTSTSGGTDICGVFVGGSPTLPVYAGEIQARALGAKVEAWSPEGAPLVGEQGELVVTEPMPSMPLYFWGDDDGARYRESYFETYPGVWRHGDWIEVSPRGTAVISGRSDSTINRGGVRMGTSEIYRCVLRFDAVADALVVDLPRPGTAGWMVMFVALADGYELDAELTDQLRGAIRSECSPRHLPDAVHAVPSIPRTISGKILEVPVKRLLTGVPAERAVARDAMANPESLDWFTDFAPRVFDDRS